MEIKQLIIKNWKSLEKLELIEPNSFSVFVGPNASGKSNIFEALSYINYISKTDFLEVNRMFGGISSFKPNRIETDNFSLSFSVDFRDFISLFSVNANHQDNKVRTWGWSSNNVLNEKDLDRKNKNPNLQTVQYKQFFLNFLHLFLNNKKVEKIELNDNLKLSTAAGNLSKVLKRILSDKNKRNEIVEWLQLLIPGFENLEIKSEELSGTDVLLLYEKGTKRPFSGSLISDGTYNIIALITAVYQSDEPQFLLIEEPENGLNPKVIKELVNLFRQKCEEEGHFIWLNTHSQTLVNQLKENEIILVDKINGATKVKQLKKGDSSGLPMDEAWLTNTLGGGIPW